MTILFIILGILLISGGFSCIFTPLLTYMSVGYYVVIMISVFSIVGIIKAIVEKRFGVSFVFDILSPILGIVMLSFPESLLFAEGVMLMMTSIWFVIMGIVTIFNAVSFTRELGSKVWILQLIFGILTVIIGISSLIEPLRMAVTLGVLIGIFFIETGFTLMFSGFVAKER